VKIKIKTKKIMALAAYPADTNVCKGGPVLMCTGAKARYLGGGWWNLFGYHPNKEDIKRIITQLEAGIGVYISGGVHRDSSGVHNDIY